jgi:hypothetical protein
MGITKVCISLDIDTGSMFGFVSQYYSRHSGKANSGADNYGKLEHCFDKEGGASLKCVNYK